MSDEKPFFTAEDFFRDPDNQVIGRECAKIANAKVLQLIVENRALRRKLKLCHSIINDPKYAGDLEWVKINIRGAIPPGVLEEL